MFFWLWGLGGGGGGGIFFDSRLDSSGTASVTDSTWSMGTSTISGDWLWLLLASERLTPIPDRSLYDFTIGVVRSTTKPQTLKPKEIDCGNKVVRENLALMKSLYAQGGNGRWAGEHGGFASPTGFTPMLQSGPNHMAWYADSNGNPMPAPDGSYAIIHTHPNSGALDRRTMRSTGGWSQVPSPLDYQTATTFNLPNYTLTSTGIWIANPGATTPVQVAGSQWWLGDCK